MDADEARECAHQFLIRLPPAEPDAVLSGVEEHEQCFVAFWTTQRSLASGDPADAPAPGIGPIAVPKNGAAPLYLGSQRLDVALHHVGLGPEPDESRAPGWD